MFRTLYLSGEEISGWLGVEVWQVATDKLVDITNHWDWSRTHHEHYEVSRCHGGSYWVPVSTNPPRSWGSRTRVIGTDPQGVQPVNPRGNEWRPESTFIWIPQGSIPAGIYPGQASNSIIGNFPLIYPPRLLTMDVSLAHNTPSQRRRLAMSNYATHIDSALEAVLHADDPSDQNAFQDADGLISFVNMTSAFVKNNKQFPTGQAVGDSLSNFIATLRPKVFGAMQKGTIAPVGGDPKPQTQWDPPVIHYMFYLLTQTGGLTNFAITSENYSTTSVIADFSTDFVKLIFDTAVVPASVVAGVTKFLQGVGNSLRTSWDNKSRNYQNTLLGQVHEAVPLDGSGNDYRYFPKIKYYHIDISSEQQEFTTPCTDVKRITFNFKYEHYVTALASGVLDDTSNLHKSFTAFLGKAQSANAKEADNSLDMIIGTSSASAALLSPIGEPGVNVFGVDLSEYPRALMSPPSAIEQLLNGA